ETDGTATALSPQWARNYIYLGGRLLATQQPNGAGGDFVEYHHADRLGTRVVSNATDASYYEQAALPFGTALNAESTGATGRRFTSYDRSPSSGLDYAVNRHYDPMQGRFTQVDPLGMEAANLNDPQTLNMYAYCANDPVNQVDPSGLGFFSFFKKLFSGIVRALRWVAIAVVVAVAIISVVGLVAGAAALKVWLTTTTLGKIVGFIAGIPKMIGDFVLGVGKAIAGAFSFVAEEGALGKIAGLVGSAVLAGASAGASAISRNRRRRQRRRRRRPNQTQERRVDTKPSPAPSAPTIPPRAMEPGTKDLDDNYTVGTCAEYGRQGRPDLESACRFFGDAWIARCIRRCLLDNFGTTPGGVHGQTGEYRGLNTPWFPGSSYGPLAHAKCFAKCGGKGALYGLGASKG
ncbi:MAG TPA: RHS repeat-associated core domain-containing protein, partial [Pyrinomonadaceae bacterium]|nr:RHS repeat-associated core domain-containing protein [Pyrinomonadaceae bacterium]